MSSEMKIDYFDTKVPIIIEDTGVPVLQYTVDIKHKTTVIPIPFLQDLTGADNNEHLCAGLSCFIEMVKREAVPVYGIELNNRDSNELQISVYANLYLQNIFETLDMGDFIRCRISDPKLSVLNAPKKLFTLKVWSTFDDCVDSSLPLNILWALTAPEFIESITMADINYIRNITY